MGQCQSRHAVQGDTRKGSGDAFGGDACSAALECSCAVSESRGQQAWLGIGTRHSARQRLTHPCAKLARAPSPALGRAYPGR